jgi:hypothetical protein
MHEQHHPDNEQTQTGTDGSERGGYCKPPKHTRFKKGVSGNPAGRPRGSQNVKSRVRDVYFEQISIIDSGKRRSVPAIVAIALLQRQRAINGNVRAAEWGSKQVKEFGLLEEPSTFSVSDDLMNRFISWLNESSVRELIDLS